MSVQALMMATYATALRKVDGADFDGTNDHMTRGAGLTGAADSKSAIFSCWVRIDGGDGTDRYFLQGSGAGAAGPFIALDGTTNKFVFLGFNPAISLILNMSTAASYVAGATWRHVLCSWDLAAGATHIYVNDVSDKAVTTATNDVIDYTLTDYFIGSNITLASRMNGCMAEFFFAPGQFLDFSVTANRRKFISAAGKPMFLGPTGSLPTGTAPIIYLSLAAGEAVANFATNRGTGGNFTITGTLDTATTSPSD